jgi:ApbE superfamily uncharacterized protein (UPF0280 family)
MRKSDASNIVARDVSLADAEAMVEKAKSGKKAALIFVKE